MWPYFHSQAQNPAFGELESYYLAASINMDSSNAAPIPL
jgi:hypothetical protein